MHSEFGHKDLKNVGNYQLGRLIGKGSFGKVYLATHKLTNGSKVRTMFFLLSRQQVMLTGPRLSSNPRTKTTQIWHAKSTTTANSSTRT